MGSRKLKVLGHIEYFLYIECSGPGLIDKVDMKKNS